MGWGNCGTDSSGRPIGYAVEATCDAENCNRRIDRGLSYVCGSMHGGWTHGCGRYFCASHLLSGFDAGDHFEQLCAECAEAYFKANPPDPPAEPGCPHQPPRERR